jgi:hypothetical protein
MSCAGGHLGFPIGISEITNMIKAKLYMHVHWMVLYKPYVFCSDMKFKMAATAGLSLTLIWSCVNIITCGGSHLGFPIGIKNRNFVEDLPMIIPGQFGFNCPSGFREEALLTLDPMRKMFKCLLLRNYKYD